MQQSKRKLLSYLLAFTLALSNVIFSSNVAAYENWDNVVNDEPTAGTMLADAFMVRPFMLVGTIVGTVTYIVTLPSACWAATPERPASHWSWIPQCTHLYGHWANSRRTFRVFSTQEPLLPNG